MWVFCKKAPSAVSPLQKWWGNDSTARKQVKLAGEEVFCFPLPSPSSSIPDTLG